MGTLEIRFRTSCPSCWRPVPVNAVTQSVMCSACKASVPIDWQRVWESLTLEEDSVMAYGGAGQQELTWKPLLMKCAGCARPLDMDRIEVSDRSTFLCMCGKLTRIRRFPKGEAWSGGDLPKLELVSHLLGEDPSLLEDTDGVPVAVANPSAPTVFPCPTCGGSLPVDGTTRLVACTFCQTRAYLPDDLWLSLNPVPKPEPWFLHFRSARVESPQAVAPAPAPPSPQAEASGERLPWYRRLFG
jgi:hypothetical protein